MLLAGKMLNIGDQLQNTGIYWRKILKLRWNTMWGCGLVCLSTDFSDEILWNVTHSQGSEKEKKPQWSESAREQYRPSDRPLSAKLVPTFADRGCHVVSVTDPYARILGFLDRIRCFLFQVSPQLYSRGWVGPVLLLLRKSDSSWNRTRTSGSVARTTDH
jgi:hypothetical protein